MINSVLELWEITPEELTSIVEQNPSLRGMMLGYIAEKKFHDMWLGHPEITCCHKHDDHDRKKKGDRIITYKGQDIIIEVKSLQTNTIRKEGKTWMGKAQVDASDRRKIIFPDGSTMETTCLKVGEFDLLAVNLFAFENKWRFVFAKNKDLPRSSFNKYSPVQQQNLLATLVEIRWPPSPPFYEDPFPLLDDILRERTVKRGLPRGTFTKTRK